MKYSKRKTEHRFRGVTIPTSTHPIIRQVKRQGADPSIHGNKLWKSSRLIIDYLNNNPPEHSKRVLDVALSAALLVVLSPFLLLLAIAVLLLSWTFPESNAKPKAKAAPATA